MVNVRRSGLIWGVILVTAGGLFMLNTLGVLAIDPWKLVFPGILVLAGLWVLAGKAVDPDMASAGRQPERIALNGAARASVRMHLDAGEMKIGAGAAPGELAAASLAGGIESELRREGDAINVDLRAAPGMWLHMLNPLNWGGHRLDWRTSFSEDIPLDLSLEAWISTARLDLEGLHIPSLELRTTLGETRVSLPAQAGHTAASVRSVLGETHVHVPQGVAARIDASSDLGEISVDEGRFPRLGAAYQSPDYDTAEHKVEIEAAAVLGEVRIY